jgi:hypothetical protein
LSGFKRLKSLSVLDIDCLDIITELKSCVRNSAGTLTKLKLSFSDSLASQARKPPPDVDPDDSDQDDEFQPVPVPPPPGPGYHDDVSGPAKAFRAQEERKSQETVLGRIFDVEPYVVKKPSRKRTDKDKESKEEPTQNPGGDFINAIKAVSSQLMKDLNGTGDFTAAQQDILDTIENAARKYVASEEAKTGGDKNDQTKREAGSGSTSTSTSTSEATTDEKDSAESKPSGGSLFEPKTTKPKDSPKDVNPEDIDIEEPEGQLVIDPQEPTKEDFVVVAKDSAAGEPAHVSEASTSNAPPMTDGAAVSPSVEKAMANLAAQKVNFQTLAEKLETFQAQANQLNKEIQDLRTDDGAVDPERIADAEKQLKSFSRNILDIQKEMHIVEAEIDDAEKQIPLVAAAEDADAQNRAISEYLRSTRGLALQSLSIYLIPVKASVLSRAVDLCTLRRLTLLNVGPQAPIWAHLTKENKESPLALRKIFTDNVSVPFLTFVSQLDELHELFILERDSKYKPESFAPKTTTTIDQIRRMVLRKHMHTLKRLMIKNQLDHNWDMDEKTILLICGRAKRLQELAGNMGIKAVVSTP